MMILIEGMDNTGKTTLSKKIQEYYSLPQESIIHSPGKDTPERMADRVDTMIEHSKSALFVWDRIHCISDQIYARVLNRSNCFVSNPRCRETWGRFVQSNPIIIYARPPIEKILNFGFREQMAGVRERALDLIFAYDQFMLELRALPEITLYQYDYSGTYNIKHTMYLNEYSLLPALKGRVGKFLKDNPNHQVDFQNAIKQMNQEGFFEIGKV